MVWLSGSTAADGLSDINAAVPAGVISVAVFGLFGAATSRWDMSIEEESEAFEKFWDTLSFVANTVVFFFSGMACVNFAVRWG